MASQTQNRLQSTPAATCMKIMLTVFNFIFWISGIAILGLGIWMKVELHTYVELTADYSKSTPYILIGVGAGIILIASLGCVCTVKGKSYLLYVYAVFLILIFVAELSVAIAAFWYKSKFQEGFKKSLYATIQDYQSDEADAKAVNRLQAGLHCCGSESYRDWFTVDWSGTGISDTVPETCCVLEEKGCGLSPFVNGTIFEVGCAKKVTQFMESNFIIIGATAIAFSFLQLFGAILACCLAKNINKSKYEQVQ